MLVAGCATAQYAVRPTPAPDESADALHIERTISQVQGKELEQQGGRRLGPTEQAGGFEVQRIVDRLSRVTERPSLHYRAYLYHDNDPNAAALADGRIYLSTGMVNYLAKRGSREDEPFDSASPRSGQGPSVSESELAFILGHELAHTVAQHLVKRYRMLQQQQLLMGLVAAGASAVTRDASSGVQQVGELALDAVSLLRDVSNSGYSQEQELEADQLGIRYVTRAGFEPAAALDLLRDFSRFESPWPFLRTHPYTAQRYADLRRYLAETGRLQPRSDLALNARRKALRDAQRLYPEGSISWQNLQRQIDALEDGGGARRDSQ